MIAQVIVDHRSKAVDRLFDYLIPENLTEKIGVGTRVLVPFSAGNNVVAGYCVGITESSDSTKLKSIVRTADDVPAFDDKMLELIEYMHERYLAMYLDLIHTVVPSGTELKSHEWIVVKELSEERSELRKQIISCLLDNGGGMETEALNAAMGRDVKTQVREMVKKGVLEKEYRHSREVHDKTIRAVRLLISPEQAADEILKLEKKAPVQAKMLEILRVNDFIAVSDLKQFAGGSGNAVASLCKKGFAGLFELTVERNPLSDKKVKTSKPCSLTSEQQTAVDAVCAAIDDERYKAFLLHGVTGSGKTEVFMQSIAHVLEKGKTALVLVPEISLTPQMVSRFLARFGERIAVLHSGLSLGERYDEWKRIQSGGADIVIGARSAVFAPLKNIGIIIIDEEHSDTYKSEMSPRYDAKEAAEFRAKQYGAVLLLASATPSVQSYFKAGNGDMTLLTMKHRYNNNKMPDMRIVDMREELAQGNRSMFSRALSEEIKKNLESGEQTILFLNRRGFSTFVSCRSCGFTAECPNCSISLTYHKYGNILKCHYCGYSIPNYRSCPQCGSRYIRYFGGGTQRVETEIQKLFPGITTIRMDVDTTGRKQSHEKILEKFEKEKINILIGTQMVSKGLDFENVTLVGVVSADTMLHINDYRSAERTFAMLEQVTGRAGRGSKKGRAVVQTYSPESEAIVYAEAHDYESFCRTETERRELMWYPPFSEIVSIMFSGGSESLVPQAARFFLKLLGKPSEMGQRVQILGPVPAAVSKVKNKYRWQLLIKCEKSDRLNPLLKNACAECEKNKNYRTVSVIVDKNPNMVY